MSAVFATILVSKHRLGRQRRDLKERRRLLAVLLHDLSRDLDELDLDAELLFEPIALKPQIHLELP